jgi:tRNA A37 threonylcarbamoyladenosine synthetase subunit TsaC/SUA5/YrdC
MVNLQRDKIAGKPSTIIKLTNDKLKLLENRE